MRKSDAPEMLSDRQRSVLRAWQRSRFPDVTASELADLVEECLDWHRANGKQRVDWIATCRNWVRKEMRWRGERERKLIQLRTAARVTGKSVGDKWEAFEMRNGYRHERDPRRQN